MRRSKPPEGNYQQQQFFAKDKEDGGYARADVPVLALQCYELEGLSIISIVSADGEINRRAFVTEELEKFAVLSFDGSGSRT